LTHGGVRRSDGASVKHYFLAMVATHPPWPTRGYPARLPSALAAPNWADVDERNTTWRQGRDKRIFMADR